MAVRRIMATSGGFVVGDRYSVMRPGATLTECLRLSGRDRPRLTFVMTASGDNRDYLVRSYHAMSGWSVDVTHLELFMMPNSDPRETLLGSDVIWVGGGSVANLLAVWQLHGVDDLMREAWDNGTILAGVSAGSLCWHIGGTTDSFGPKLRPVTNALGLLPYGNGVHYDSEEQRRPLLHELVGNDTLPLSYATDDSIGILYEDTEPVAVVADPDGPRDDTSPAAYRVEKVGGQVVETRLPAGPVRG